ncbi:MAG: hypothetical protein WA626_01510, partial [Acidobacteriaceae bacterium]
VGGLEGSQRRLRELETEQLFIQKMRVVQGDTTTQPIGTKGLPETMQTRSCPRLVENWARKNLALLWQDFQRNASEIFIAIS